EVVDVRGLLALADVAAQLLRLLEAQPYVPGVSLRLRHRPQQGHIQAAIVAPGSGIEGKGGVEAISAACRLPGTCPGPDALVESSQDGRGDGLVVIDVI